MVLAKRVRESFAKSAAERSETFTMRLRSWRKKDTVVRAERPTNPTRARSLGYKAAKGYVIARVKIKRGKRSRNQPDLGRKPGRNVKRVNPGVSLKGHAIDKAKRKFINLIPINAYWVGQDGVYKYFEVVLRDPVIT
ncbi:hypothetical protein HZC09_01405 [Candidatus Micrarchaeota archaeon]|nr:hypothetical protein [Candidatus Micrarchaeota archaeon]